METALAWAACPVSGTPLVESEGHLVHPERPDGPLRWRRDEDGAWTSSGVAAGAGAREDVPSPFLASLRDLQPGALPGAWSSLVEQHPEARPWEGFDPAPADWTLLADLHGRVVWEHAVGGRAIAHALARSAARVVATNPSRTATRVEAHAARLLGRPNLHAVQAEPEQAPLAPGSVDRIVLSGGLEGLERGAKVRRLAHLHARLAPEGELWFPVANRLSPFHVHRVRAGTERGWRRALARAGFGDVHVHHAFLEARRPRFVVTSSRGPMLRHYLDAARQGGSRKARLGLAWIRTAHRMGLAGALCPTLLVRASR